MPTAFEKQIDVIANRAALEIDRVIEDIRAKYVIPYCDKHNLHFVAGMGTWSFTKPMGYSVGGWNADELPKRLRDALTIEYPLNKGQDIGSLMMDYKPANFRRIV